MNVSDYILPEHLQGEQKALAELIGMDAYIKLVKVYGGEKMFISRLDSIISANRSVLIKAALEHENEAEIAAYFHVSRREIERIKFGCK